MEDWIKTSYRLREEREKRKREWRAEYRQALKDLCVKHGLCQRCHTEAVVPGLTVCSVCREKERKRALKRYAARIGKINRLKEERKAMGICVHCGKYPARDGRTECDVCTSKNRERYRVKKNLLQLES